MSNQAQEWQGHPKKGRHSRLVHEYVHTYVDRQGASHGAGWWESLVGGKEAPLHPKQNFLPQDAIVAIGLDGFKGDWMHSKRRDLSCVVMAA